ncbi:UNVERIFIED_CONTAM: hypothetical protein Sradi_6931300 [Sesamum radiatum]|uniref:Uncharacterized protein n=1 Tax=Sesamum radiatum TaxID=300843 RepID=A0AAW2JGD3_SESRA
MPSPFADLERQVKPLDEWVLSMLLAFVSEEAKRSISERLRRDQVRIPGKCPMRFFLFLLVASARI